MLPRSFVAIFVAVALLPLSTVHAEEESVLLQAMGEELTRSFENLKDAEDAPLYFLMYAVTEGIDHSLSASLGAIQNDSDSHSRTLDMDLRVGSPKLDNTHQIRGGRFRGGFRFGGGGARVPVEDDPAAIKAQIWLETDDAYKKAQERFINVKANRAVKVEEEDLSDDFSEEEASVYLEAPATLEYDKEAWRARVKKLSLRFKGHPFVYRSAVSLSANTQNRYMVSSEGTKIQVGQNRVRLGLMCWSKAEDGMELRRYESFDAASWDKLPSDEVVEETIDVLIEELGALREAPLIEPYIGPAILMNRASGVFFHEIFGHRIEGHRQKSEEEGQTFTKKVGKVILPEFLSIYDDPTMETFGGVDLRGHYKFDDEGVATQRVPVVEKGILKNFLMSRSPVKGFARSNGHGRRSPGNKVVSRQGNLTVVSEKSIPFEELKTQLMEEVKKQDKEYGLIFDDISGGFTSTGRRGVQSFKVIPLVVRKVYADGRPDEIVRGADIVGTPLTSFSKIIATGDDSKVFNGTCGAESGWVPVSAISPSILVSEIEIEKKYREQDKPPILPPPGYEPKGEE